MTAGKVKNLGHGGINLPSPPFAFPKHEFYFKSLLPVKFLKDYILYVSNIKEFLYEIRVKLIVVLFVTFNVATFNVLYCRRGDTVYLFAARMRPSNTVLAVCDNLFMILVCRFFLNSNFLFVVCYTFRPPSGHLQLPGSKVECIDGLSIHSALLPGA